jgi:hypothetical protein
MISPIDTHPVSFAGDRFDFSLTFQLPFHRLSTAYRCLPSFP